MAECRTHVPGERNQRIRNLFALYRNPDPDISQSAKEALVAENGGLINYLIDKSYSSYKAKHQEDLFQAGAYGMILSFKTFDPDKGAFSTHAARYIEHELYDYITTFVNGIKPYYSSNIKKVRRAIESLNAQGITSPTTTDVAIESGLPASEVKRALDAIEKSQTISTETDEARDAMLAAHSPEPSEVYNDKELMEILYKCLGDLPREEMIAVCMKFKLGPYNTQDNITHQDIAKAINVAVPNVKGVLASAIRKLRKNKNLATMLGSFEKQKDTSSDVSVVPIAGAERETMYLIEDDDEEEFKGGRAKAQEFFTDCNMDLFS